MFNKTIFSMQEDAWIDSSFKDELLEFTRANRAEKDRAVQKAKDRGRDQKEIDKERKSGERKDRKQEDSSNPWKSVVIVKTVQDGKTRLIPKSDFEQGRHELLYGEVSGQPPKPEVTPNVAQEIASQPGFEPSKTSNKLLGVQKAKKRGKEEIIRSDHYDYPKDGIKRKDTTSTYPDWDHAPDTIAQGISLVANSTGGKQVDINTIRQFFGQSSTLMDSSIRAYQQLGEIVKGSFSVTTPEQAYPVVGPWAELSGGMDIPNTDLIIQDQSGNVYSTSIIYDKTKIIDSPEATVLFNYSLEVSIEELLKEEKVKKQVNKLIKKIGDYLLKYNEKDQIKQKYLFFRADDFKNEILSDIEKIFEISDVFEKTCVMEALTGNEKFDGKIPGVANALMSTSLDGTNLKFSPLNETTIRRLLGETELKIKCQTNLDQTPFDEMYNLLVSGKQISNPNISEILNIREEVSDAKFYFDQFMSQQENTLLGILSFVGLQCQTIIVKNINLDAVGSIGNGDFNKITVNDKTFYIGVEKDIPYYDNSALRLEDISNLLNIIEEGRDYKKEYREYHGKPNQIKRRSSRNGARRKLEKEGRVSPGDGKDVDHKDRNPLNNGNGNLRVRGKSSNRGDNKDTVKEEYGAGEEATIELLLKYVNDTPYMTLPKEFLAKGKKNDRKSK